MNIGFFADDRSASQAALLAATAFNRRDPGSPCVIAGSNALADAVPEYLDAARMQGRPLMVALPLAQLRNRGIRSRVDLAVVTYGPSLIARDCARRAMAAEGDRPDAHVTPAWLLAGSCRPNPDLPRTLPVGMATLRPHEAADLREGCTCGKLHQRAISLAAAVRIAAEDPYAPSLDPSAIAEILQAGGGHAPLSIAEARLREDLLDLAADLDRGPMPRPLPSVDRRRVPDADRRIGVRMRRPPVTARDRGALVPASTLRHAADCPCVAIA